MSGYNNTRSAFAGAVLGAALLTGMWAWSADYPPQGGGGGASGDFAAGGDSTFDSLTLNEANGDVVLARSAAGTLAVSNGPEADGDGVLKVDSILQGSSSRMYKNATSGYLTFDNGAGGAGNFYVDGNLYITSNPESSSGPIYLSAYSNTLALTTATLSFGANTDILNQGSKKTLTDGVATTVFSVVTGDGDMAGLKIDYTIQATDATEYQSESGTVHIAIVDDAGGVVASTPGEVSVQALSSGTLTSTWSVVTTDDQSIEIQVTADSSLTTSTFQIRWVATYSGDVSLTGL